MKATLLLLGTLTLTTSVFALGGTDKKFGPPIMINVDGTSTVFASNALTDDCAQPPVFPEPAEPLPANGSTTSFAPKSPELLCDNSYPHLRGAISILGAAADAIFEGMRDVKLHPGVPNILERDRNSLSWDEVPYKTGRNIFCFQFPVKKDGKAILETACRIEVSNLNKGEIDTNDQSK